MARKNHDSTVDVARRPGRRQMLQMSAAGGLTLASGLFGGLLAPGQAAGADGSITPQNGKLRRVVSGLNPEGKSYIAIDDSAEVANLFTTPGGRVLGEVATNEPAQLPMNATGQTRCFVAAIPPHKDQKPTIANRIGFHKGAGISYCLILNGTLTYMTDTQETLVRSGDLVVERSTLHSWRNEGTTPVSMFIVTVSAT
jgi:mannose-6-phosphate isomerase-like protein (cupin superfamily)